MVKTSNISLSVGSSQSPSLEPSLENVPIDDYVNDKLHDFDVVLNQVLNVFEFRLLQRLTSNQFVDPLKHTPEMLGVALVCHNPS